MYVYSYIYIYFSKKNNENSNVVLEGEINNSILYF